MPGDRLYVPIEDITPARLHSTRVVPLWVDGSPALDYALSDKKLVFGKRPVNSESGLYLKINNTGYMPIKVEAVYPLNTSTFQVEEEFPRTVRPGNSMDIWVMFKPNEADSYTGELIVEIDQFETQRIPLSGSAI